MPRSWRDHGGRSHQPRLRRQQGSSAQTATTNGSLINVGGTTSTGFVYSNFAQTLTTTADKLFTTTVGLAAFENRVTGAVGATGFVIPAVDS
jgi:hypothetical protein